MSEVPTVLGGVHHTARPTWKLKETVEFYNDILGLPIVHAISAVGWGPEDHPDFIHLFFGAGRDSTIAFFYYLGTPPLESPLTPDHWLYKSVHTAWRVETRDELLAWKERLEARGLSVLQVRHEIIESIYVTDPNGYMIEFTWQVREMTTHDGLDAELTLRAAIAIEEERGAPVTDIETVWRRKGALVAAQLDEVA
ncbi:VOC family protein [Sphingomonas profundi]|uniref:VOC family protein n=1 Tax=Alterirhizorhabdus profundi TaxID=2681549 RepID=UPI0018D03D63|nr:VOC family protein [Sphingomonas profundi]